MPIFKLGCTLSSVCHGQMGNSDEENLYLGLNAGGGGSADSQTVYGGLVGVASKEDTSMKLVTAGDIANSYLWHKLIGDQNSNASVAGGCASATTCFDCTTTTPCGESMPYLGLSLGPDDLCTIENWSPTALRTTETHGGRSAADLSPADGSSSRASARGSLIEDRAR
jgi:hypothetical protein